MARLLAAEGARLTIAARDQEELERAQEDLNGYAANPQDIAIVRCDSVVAGRRRTARRDAAARLEPSTC
jgi:short-subunit dehydrogenase